MTNSSGSMVKEAQRWAQGFQAMAQKVGRHFARSEARDRVNAYLRELLSCRMGAKGERLYEMGRYLCCRFSGPLGNAGCSCVASSEYLRSCYHQHAT